MTSTSRRLIERPDLEAKPSERVDQDSMDRLALTLAIIAAVMLVVAGVWIIFGSASLVSLMIIFALALILISSPSSA
jgi:hypothetical protein